MTSDEAPGRRRGEAWLLAIGALSVAVSLVVRIVERGAYIPGCDLIAPTVGHFLLSTRSFADAVHEAWWQNRHFFLPFPTYSIPFVFIPGLLEMLWPWEYWVHVVVFLAFLLLLLAILRAADLPLRSAGFLLLAWGASPVLLTYALVGEPWSTAFLATALALWVTMSRWLRRHAVLTLVCTLFVVETSWHVYELGKPVGVVFLAGAVLLRDVPLFTRAVWLVVGAGQLWDALVVHRTLNINAFAYQEGSPWHVVDATLAVALHGLQGLVHRLVALELDLPVVFGLGVASLFFFKRDRLFLLALLVFQLVLQVLLAAYGADNLRPRRFMMVEGYALVCLASMYREASARVRRGFVALLLAGNLWQAVDLWRFVKAPRAPQSFTMPHMFSEEGVGMVDYPTIDVARELEAQVRAGQRLLLVYNFDCLLENFTNPVGLLEHLYLTFGHRRFVDSVLVFGSNPCRYDCLPFRPLQEFQPFLDGIRADGPTPPSTITGYYTPLCRGSGNDGAELETMWKTIGERFVIKSEPLGKEWRRFTILGRRLPALAPSPSDAEPQVDERP